MKRQSLISHVRLTVLIYVFVAILLSIQLINAEQPKYTIDSQRERFFPLLRSSVTNDSVAEKINQNIEGFFSNGWFETVVKSEISDTLFLIEWQGFMTSPYPVDGIMMYSLHSGEEITLTRTYLDDGYIYGSVQFPKGAFFNNDGYHNLLEAYWDSTYAKAMKNLFEDSCRVSFKQSYAPNLLFTDTSLILEIRDGTSLPPYESQNCHADGRFMAHISVPISDIKSFLSPLGKEILFTTNYLSSSSLQRLVLYQKYERKISELQHKENE